MIPDDPWLTLKRFTDARIGLGRSGAGMPTSEVLKFSMAHAQARDAVRAVGAAAQPIADVRGSVAYKRAMAVEFAARALVLASQRASAS